MKSYEPKHYRQMLLKNKETVAKWPDWKRNASVHRNWVSDVRLLEHTKAGKVVRSGSRKK